MIFSKTLKLKLGLIKSWPLANKVRLSKAFINPKMKSGTAIFDGLSILNREAIISTNTSNYLEYSIFTTGTYEPEISSLIKSQLFPGQYAIDIGANIGIHTITMAKAVGKSGKVFAFEPVKYLNNRLKQNLNLNNLDNVTVIPYALSDKEEIVKVNFDPQAANLGTTSLGNPSEFGNETLEVKVGDEIIKAFQLTQLDLIKIDVEGFELRVLEGLKEIIEKYRPRIIFEYDSNYIQRINDREENIQELLFNFFNSRNYSLYFIQEQGLTAINSVKDLPNSGNLFALINKSQANKE